MEFVYLGYIRGAVRHRGLVGERHRNNRFAFRGARIERVGRKKISGLRLRSEHARDRQLPRRLSNNGERLDPVAIGT